MEILTGLCPCAQKDFMSIVMNSYGLKTSYYCPKCKTLSLLHAPPAWIVYILNHEQIHEVLNGLEGYDTSKGFDKLFVKKRLSKLCLIDKYMYDDGTPRF